MTRCALATALLGAVVGCAREDDRALANRDVEDALRVVAATPFPDRYSFVYEPGPLPLESCLTGPSPILDVAVDASDQRVAVQERGRPDRRAVITGQVSYLNRSLLEEVAADPTAEWYSLSGGLDEIDHAARTAIGAILLSFVAPPRLPPNPHDVLAEALDSNPRVSSLGDRTVGPHATDAYAITTGASDSGDRSLYLEVDVDEQRLVRRMRVGHATADVPASLEPDGPLATSTFDLDVEPQLEPAPDDAAPLQDLRFRDPAPAGADPPDCSVTIAPGAP